MNLREIAFEILNKTISDKSYASLLMRERLNSIPAINRPFVSELVYGTLRNYDFLLYQIKDEIKEDTKNKLKHILSLALYEKFYMNSKDYAVVNEYVNLVNNKYDKGFINAILRNVNELHFSNDISIDNSLPKWIVSLLSSQYKDEFDNILDIYKRKPTVYYRINKNKCDINELKISGIKLIDDRYFIADKSLLDSKEFKDGLFYVQDYNSKEIVDNLDLKRDSVFLDMCSAPGTKLFNVLEIVKEENVYANDLYENRVSLIKKGLTRLGYKNVNLINADATKLKDSINISFDRILLDAPCSGLGVISRRPDIKFHVTPESLDELEKLQAELLESAYSLLKEGGILVYSTCTLNKKENNRQISSFLSKHKDISLINEKSIIDKCGDCFYLAKLKRL